MIGGNRGDSGTLSSAGTGRGEGKNHKEVTDGLLALPMSRWKQQQQNTIASRKAHSPNHNNLSLLNTDWIPNGVF